MTEATFMLERADYTTPGRADDLLRSLEWFADETGHVDSSFGWVGLVDITRDTIADYVASAGDPWVSERRNVAPGWYVVVVDHLGFIDGHHYATEADARADFDAVADAYATSTDD